MKRRNSPSLYALLLVALTTASIEGSLEENRQEQSELDRARSSLLAIAKEIENGQVRLDNDSMARLFSDHTKNGLGAYGLAVCSPYLKGGPLGVPAALDWARVCRLSQQQDNFSLKHNNREYGAISLETNNISGKPLHFIALLDLAPLHLLWFEVFIRTFLLVMCGGAAILLIVAANTRKAVESHLLIVQRALRAISHGKKPSVELTQNLNSDLGPISRQIGDLAAKIVDAPSSSLRMDSVSSGGSSQDSLQKAISNRTVVVVSNREPYIHRFANEKIEVSRPASGLVTALEPVLRQCGGIWIAHGSGSADWNSCNEAGEVEVPPWSPKYKLRRVRLSKEEEEGYYYGFSNEGLWPLCHLAHTRPIFKLSDWQHYRAVNEKFSSTIREAALPDQSLILVQDYHFALLPRFLKDTSKNRQPPRIGLFWHIPWPNPEAFGICPWNKELLHGMLGADVIGFHTQYHCNNFLETCDRYLESRIDWESFSVTRENHETLVRAFPIGIDTAPITKLQDFEKEQLKRQYGIKAKYVAVGVDRLDYTKGIVERVQSVERFLEKNPAFIGQFSLVQMGSPSRTQIPAYQNLSDELQKTVDRVNARFSAADPSGEYKAVLLLAAHHEWDEVQKFYQLGDTCMVTSLHDGMNLVSKEYVWCQRPDKGMLILSRFAGASRELKEALIVNPYSIEETADAIATALTMPVHEKTQRMQAMRKTVENNSAFQWASDLVFALVSNSRPPISP